MGGNNASFSVACGGVTLCRRRGQEKVTAVNADENPKRGDITLVTGVIGADMRDAFELAKQKAPAIIFIDELDALGRALDDLPGLAKRRAPR